MRTAVEAVFVGKDRRFNRRFLQMCGHYLVEPTGCTPAAGWRRGRSRTGSATSASACSRRACRWRAEPVLGQRGSADRLYGDALGHQKDEVADLVPDRADKALSP
jgi:hypothetical protein